MLLGPSETRPVPATIRLVTLSVFAEGSPDRADYSRRILGYLTRHASLGLVATQPAKRATRVA